MLTLPVLQMGFQVPSGAVWSNTGIKINTRQLRHDNAFAKADTGVPERRSSAVTSKAGTEPCMCVSALFMCTFGVRLLAVRAMIELLLFSSQCQEG